MKSDFWYFFLFCFQVEVLTGDFNNSAKSEMFISHSGGLQILCKYSETVKQLKMELRRGEKILCELTKTTGNRNTVSTKNEIFCQSQLSNNSVSFFLYNLDASHANYYSCKLSIFDPPPYREEIIREYLHIYESQNCCQMRIWLPIGCAVFVTIFCLGCVFICWLTRKKSQSSVSDRSSEYVIMASVPTAKTPGPRGMTQNLRCSGAQA
ncbi:inducible T-cell costimulator [Sorex fumeus]|uniref:inducible T-cell costimulator n=1 Tax=Sorex fumeus TaxID=62283 RepID=UPI0024AE7D32|nr:inducible T-cell costimulator [Sorex fumeus]